MKPLGRVVVVGAAGIAACVLLVSGALQSGSGTKNGEMGVASDGNFSAHPNLSRKASGGLDLSRVQVTDEDSEEVQPSAWNVLASDAADRIERAVLDSGGKAIYSTIVIDRTQKEIVVYFTTAPASETLDAIRQASDDIPVKVLDEAKVTNAQFVEMVEHMYATIDPKRVKVALISPNASNTAVHLTIWPAQDQMETERAVKEMFSPMKVIVDNAPRPDESNDFAARWNDASLFKGGAGIVSFLGSFCSSGFAAKRNSDGIKVMITAAHCGLGATWSTAAGGDEFGSGWMSSNATDAQYLSAPTGLGYGSLVYTGGISSTATKARKNSAYDARVGDDIYAEGAASGGSAQSVVAINQYGIYGEGPGFQTDSVAAKRDVGHGDSGGPAIRLHTDGKYTPLGMVKGAGWKVNSSPREMAAQGLCEKGVVYWGGNPPEPRFCSKRSFFINTTAIERALGVDIYQP